MDQGRILPSRAEENILLFCVSEGIYFPFEIKWKGLASAQSVPPTVGRVGWVVFVHCFGWCHFMKHPLDQLIQTPLEDTDIYAATLASQLVEPSWNCAFTMNNSGYILLATRTCDGPSAERLRATSAVTLTGICRLFSQCGEENVPFAQLFPQLTERHLKGNEL